MKKLPQIVFILLAVATIARADMSAQVSTAIPVCPLPGYKLAWSDEFDGAKLDESKWVYRTDSKMWSTQLPANVELRDGKLVVNLKKEDAGGKNYTGGGIISKQAFKYGYYEAKFKTPPGDGWHTSFWLMKYDGNSTEPTPAIQELDVCENDSKNHTSYGVNVHKWNPKPSAGWHKKVETPDLSADFHVYGCEFTSQAVKCYFDGKLVDTVDVSKFEHGEQNIWLTCIASKLGGTKAVDDTKLPATAEYDYVRFYEKQ